MKLSPVGICVCIALTAAAPVQGQHHRLPIEHRADAVAKYLSKSQLDPAEGVWSTRDNYYEIAIIQNPGLRGIENFELIGLITDADKKAGMKRGDVRFALKRTAEPGFYIGTAFTSKGSGNISVQLKGRNLIEIDDIPSGWTPNDRHLVRLLAASSGALNPTTEPGDVAFPDYGARLGSDAIYIDAVVSNASDPNAILPSVFVLETDVSTGTGFFIAKTGLALTNEHVIRGAKRLSARLYNGKSVPVRVIRSSDNSDAALVQVLCAEACNPVPLGFLVDVALGTEVYAIGSPFGLAQSMSKGIISAIRRMEGSMWLQTDAAVNRGNSGGPLIDAKTGRVIGINTLAVRKDVSEGLNFALPTDEALAAVGVVVRK